MLFQLCPLVLVALHGAAAESLKELCDKKDCGVTDLPIKFEGKNNMYYLANKKCYKLNLKVTEDKTQVAYILPADADFVYTVENGCLQPSPNNTGEALNEKNQKLEINLPLDACDDAYFNVECYDDKQFAFVVSRRDAPQECVDKGIEEVHKKYNCPVEPSDFGSECK